LNLAWLKRLYEHDPRLFALSQISIIVGLFLVYLWIVPVWYWAIYLGGMEVPQGLSDLLYWVWLNQKIFRGILIAVLVSVLWLGGYVRRDSLRDLGIRADNLWASGRECLLVVLVVLVAATGVVLAFPQSFSFDLYLGRGPYVLIADMLEGLLSGLVQQVLLQSVFLVGALQIFRNRYAAAGMASVIFALIHAPNLPVMALTLVFGFLCCLLFLRHRNVFTLGITHAIVKEVVRVLFVSVIASKLGYYDYNFRVGPMSGKPDYLANMEYRGPGAIEIAQSKELLLPISVTNITPSSTWNSDSANGPVFLSYHLLDPAITVSVYSSVLTPLGKPIGPGETELVDLLVKPPSEPGDYLIQVDLIKRVEGHEVPPIFFRSRGLKPLFLPLTSR